MNKHITTYITSCMLAATVAGLMPGCSSEQDMEQPQSIMIEAQVRDGSTRSATTSGVVWIWADKTDTGQEYIRAWETVASMGSQRLSSATSSKEYPEDEANLSYYAIHGNFAETIEEGTTAFGTPLTHTILETSPSNGPSDLLYGRLLNVSKDEQPVLPLRHLMCNLRVAVKLDDEEIDAASVRAVSVLFTDLLTTVTFTPTKLHDPTLQNHRDEIVQTVTDNTTRKSYLMSSVLSADFSTATYSSVIMAPQQVGADQNFIIVTLSLDDNTTAVYLFRTKATFESGRSYTYNLALSDGSAIIFSNEKLIEWEDEYILGTFNSFVIPPESLKDKIIEVGYDEESIVWLDAAAIVLALSAVIFPETPPVAPTEWMVNAASADSWTDNPDIALPLSAVVFPSDPPAELPVINIDYATSEEWLVGEEYHYILNYETFRNLTTTDRWEDGDSQDLVLPAYNTTQYDDAPDNPDPDIQDYPY